MQDVYYSPCWESRSAPGVLRALILDWIRLASGLDFIMIHACMHARPGMYVWISKGQASGPQEAVGRLAALMYTYRHEMHEHNI